MRKSLTAIVLFALGCGPVTTAGIHEEYARKYGAPHSTSSIDYVIRAEYLIEKGNCSLAFDDLDKARELSPDERLLARINYLHAQCNCDLADWALMLSREKSDMERRFIIDANCRSGEEKLHAIPPKYLTPDILQLHKELSGTCGLGHYGQFNNSILP
ncbi:MAG: hypothetical protein V2A62_02445 [Candidatus Woesearchaeota archaeon]